MRPKLTSLFFYFFLRTTLDGMVKIEGKEVKDLIDKEMAKQEGKYAQLIQQYNERSDL